MAATKKRVAPDDFTLNSKRSRNETDDHSLYQLSDGSSVRSLSPPNEFALSESQSVAETAISTRSSIKRPKKYVCDVEGCGKAFDRPVRLQAHQRTHTNDRPFVCNEPNCPKAFFKAEHLKAHIQNKHAEEASHVCGYIVSVNEEGEQFECGKRFTTATRLRRHVAAHEQKESLKCQEPGCGLVFRKIDTLQRHVKNVHLNEKAFRCAQIVFDDVTEIPDECGREFTTIGQLKAHESREHAGLRYFCDVCSPATDLSDPQRPKGTAADILEDLARVGFSTYSELQTHIKCAHPPTCEICGQFCASKRALAAHMDIEHSSLSDRQKFPCTYPDCGRSFTRHGNLKVHIQNVHVKHKRFICGQFDLSHNNKCPGWDNHGCGMAFSTKANLENHTRTQHLQLCNLSNRQVRVKTEEVSGNSTSLMALDEPSELSAVAGSVEEREALSMLTGCGYTQARPIACWNLDCPVRFTRDYDLAQHMELTHGWQVDDINDRLAEESALSGDRFWIGGDQTPETLTVSYNNMHHETQHVSPGLPLSYNLQCENATDKGASSTDDPSTRTQVMQLAEAGKFFTATKEHDLKIDDEPQFDDFERQTAMVLDPALQDLVDFA